jgi:hypothetical protein
MSAVRSRVKARPSSRSPASARQTPTGRRHAHGIGRSGLVAILGDVVSPQLGEMGPQVGGLERGPHDPCLDDDAT